MAYDLVTGQRTFYLGLSGTAPEPNNVIHDVIFRDTSGNDIKCNYFKVSTVIDGIVGLAGAWVAELSGVSHTGDMVTDTVSSVEASPSVSGICGIGGVMCAAPTSEEWHGSNGQVATGFKLQVMSEGVWFIGITYGNLFPLNTLRTNNNLIYDAGI